MPIALTCPCGRALRLKDELAGRKIICPQCRAVLTVPAQGAAAEEVIGEVPPVDEPESAPRRDDEDDEELSERERLRRKEERAAERAARRREEERGQRRRKKDRREQVRRREMMYDRPRRREFEPGWFGNVNAGIAGGVVMILISVPCFLLGLKAGWILFFPLALLIIGVAALFKGLLDR